MKSVFYVRVIIIAFWFLLCLFVLYASYLGRYFVNAQSITVLTWGEMIDPQLVNAFEKETGITVNLRYFENNEELLAKLLASKGEGFDIVIPSDYIVEKFISNKLVKPLDKIKIPSLEQIDARFLHHYYDPTNLYAIPYNWSIYGIGINKNYFTQEPVPSWDLLFKQLPGVKIQMPNTARESFLLAAYYLFGRTTQLSDNEIDLVKQLLIDQKKWIETYTDTDARAEYLLVSNTCPLVVVASIFMANSLNTYPHLDFLIPDKTTFMIIDNIMLSAKTTRDEMAYQFINYLLRDEVLKHHMFKYPFISTKKQMWHWLQEISPRLFAILNRPIEHIDFFRNIIPEAELQELWMQVKVT